MTRDKNDGAARPSKKEVREARRQVYRRRRRSRRPSREELLEAAREMHLEDPEQTEEEWYEALEFANYAFPTLDERIATQWDRFRQYRRSDDFTELKRLLARRKEFEARSRR